MAPKSIESNRIVIPLLCAGIIAGLVLIPYNLGYAAFRENIVAFLVRGWKQEQWQHGWIVLPALGYLIWHQRKDILRESAGGSWLGLPIILFALASYYVGYRVDNIYFGYAAIQLIIPGMILWLAGPRMLMTFAFPILFLTFLWPLMFLEQSITFPLRMLMSNAAVGLLQILGIDVVRNGTGILSAPDALLGLPAGKKFAVDVADPCSGIRSLFALMMVSALYAHFTLKVTWQKWVLFLCSAPLAIMGNLARIGMLTIGTIAFGAEFAIGKNALTDPSWFHMGAGYLVFIVALGGMVGIGTLLQGLGRFNLAKVTAAFDREKPAADNDSSPEIPPGTPDKPAPKRHEDLY